MEIPSSNSTSCFDHDLYDYLHSFHISSSSSTSCFDLASDYLDWFDRSYDDCNSDDCDSDWDSNIEFLKAEVGLFKTFFLYVRKCRRRNHEALLEHDHDQEEDNGNSNCTMSESLRRSIICFGIRDVVARIIHDLHRAYLRFEHSGKSDCDIIRSALTKSRENIMLFHETYIKKSCTTVLLDYSSPGDPPLVMDLIGFLCQILVDLLYNKGKKLMKTLQEKLSFLWNLIAFATKQGLEQTQLIDLLIHIEVVAANLISICRFDTDDEQVFNEMEFKISQLINEKINPLDPHVREIYICVLTASKQSRPLYDFAREGIKYEAVNFTIGLVDYLKDLLQSDTSFPDLLMNQMLKLYEAVSFLSIFHLEEEKLGDEMQDLIGAVVCDAGILILSISVDELKDGLPKEIHLSLIQLLKVFKYITEEVAHIFWPSSPFSSYCFPRTNELGSIDFFLENLKEVARCDEINDSIALPLAKIQIVQNDLDLLRSFLEKIKEQRNQNEKLQAFWNRVMEVAYEAESVIDSTLVRDKREYCLDAVARDINLMKIEAQEIDDSITYDGGKTFTHMSSQGTATIHKEDLVGLDNEVETVTRKLTGGAKQLVIVPIVGMPGLGKTTLANEVYNAPSVMVHFHIRAWCCVSQTYSKHKLLVQILCSIFYESVDQYLKLGEDDLAEKLKKVLLRNRYLIVLDDLWDVEAWNLLERSFPDDANGSRIIFTSRLQNLSSQFKPDSEPYHLRQLTDKESWKLLQNKLFGKEGCPPALSELGSQIAKNCRGLPLTVVLVAGILASTEQDCWEEFAKALSSSTILHTDNCMKTLEQSYIHLPNHLEPCILYFCAFREVQDIPIRRLLWLWISEGLVQQTEGMSLEEAADNYLRALISRSLVVVTKQRTMGGAKACRLHDLVHEFCVQKAKEESFLHIVDSRKDPSESF